MKKTLAAAAAAIAVAFIVYRLVIWLSPHETRIRWLLTDMEEAFNDGSSRGVARGLAEAFLERESGLNRQQTILVFMNFVRGNLDAEGEFLFRCRIEPDEGLAISVEPEQDPPRASVTVPVRFFRRASGAASGGAEREVGLIAFEADLVLEESRWKIERARHHVVSGERPF